MRSCQVDALKHVQLDAIIEDAEWIHPNLLCTILYIKGFIKYQFTDSETEFIFSIKFNNTVSPTLNSALSGFQIKLNLK